MAITFDATWAAQSASSTSVASGAVTPSAGCTLLVALACSTTTVNPITDNTANVWNMLPVISNPAISVSCALGYVVNPVISSTIITCHAGSSGLVTISAGSFKGTAASVPFDKASTNNNASGTAMDSLSTSNTTFANEVLIGYGIIGGGATVTLTTGSGYSAITQYLAGASGVPCYLNYQIVSAQGTYNATETIGVAHSWAAGIATFADTNVPANISAAVAWLTA